ncbi:Pfam:DUF672 [Seminavis robusta]|uniref:Pfam:DUF672 n=1 Tax=Seminavis robusta TaxID=568900 RepID=A0A9N8DDR2_9STRA|nr:Pfam:DUF672 [Seminavis robusta]|eukprot:Sro107_g053930.1 Pfam:DUF672 (362) ;mRNA; r:73683-74862
MAKDLLTRASRRKKESSSSAGSKSSSRYGMLILLVCLVGYNVRKYRGTFEGFGAPASAKNVTTAVTSTSTSTTTTKKITTTTDTTNTNNNIFAKAFHDSYGYFDDIPLVDWQRHQQWALTQIDHRYMFNPRRHYGNPALWYYNSFNPVFSCPQVKRVWGVGDGPKYVCDPHRLVTVAKRRQEEQGHGCLIYSVGSNGNYEFEDGLVNYLGTSKACEIHIFDYSRDYNRPENAPRNMHFHQLGLQGSQQNRARGEFASFPQILQKLGHENRVIDIFKIDCEGCEWDSYKDWIAHPHMRQVLIETHELPKEWDHGIDFFTSFKRNGFAMYSKEVNGFGDGKYYEFSYIKLHPQFWNNETTLVT